MEVQLREKLIAGIEKSILAIGEGSYSEGMDKARKFFGRMHEYVCRVQTLEDLRRVLDDCPAPSKIEAMTAVFVANHLPHLIRIGMRSAAQNAASTLPAPSGGRPPALSPNKTREVLDYVSLLHRKGCTLEASVQRTSLRFRVSVRTVERLWAKRELLSDEDSLSAPTVKDALRYLSSGL